ncbi:heterotrimeric G-protein alpha subunit (G-alpha, GPA2) [Cunninghamella echinulata]|nr:heterotrimeric G-protein alpha subunit (G-alpha, GPA2) [Cunninghamella echinulata]
MGNQNSGLFKRGENTVANRAIDKQIKEDLKRMKNEVKILLLGAGESGKSTILKQMKLTHVSGYHDEERKKYRPIVYENIYCSMQYLIQSLTIYNIPLENSELQKYFILFNNDIDLSKPIFPENYYLPLQKLWLDAGVQYTYTNGMTVAFNENLPYFFKRLDVLWSPGYLPSDQDIIRSKKKTTGIDDIKFSIGPLMYHLIDVGGQRSERKKWLHYFENVTAILFVVALSGYDQCLIEDHDSNQMHEALMLFNTICNSRWFKKTSMILLLNKIDIFQKKIATKPISTHFGDYTGPDNSFDQSKNYFKKRFQNLMQDKQKTVHVHFTDATNALLIQHMMMAVSDTILSEHLNGSLL